MSQIPVEYIQQIYPLMGLMGLLEADRKENHKDVEQFKTRVFEAFQSRNEALKEDVFSPISKLLQMKKVPEDGAGRFKYQFMSFDSSVPQRSMKPYGSSLSPGNPSSPLYPDGLVHPAWLQKHCEQIPSIILAFVELPQLSMEEYHPLEPSRSDIELCQTLNEIRKNCIGNRSQVKFGVVAITKSSLGDSSLEERGLYIKRACNLDNKHSFFVLSINQQNILEFVQSIEVCMQEYSHNYYRDMGKKIKKKKAKASQASFKPIISSQNCITLTGWNFRYEFKMGIYAELMQDFNSAVDCFISAYNSLMEIFKDIRNKEAMHSISSVSNYTRAYSMRWDEYIDVFDAISFKISKYSLMGSVPIRGLYQLYRHMNFIKSLRIALGEQLDLSFPFWGWASRQYALFADCVGYCQRFEIPLPEPPVSPPTIVGSDANYLSSDIPMSFAFQLTNINSPIESKEDAAVGILNTGFYYLMAGCFILCRKRAFDKVCMKIKDNSHFVTIDHFHKRLSDWVPKESEYDHFSVAIDIFTKSYEHFKRLKRSRTTLFLAYFIAEIYMEVEKLNMSLKFFERISKTFRKERWTMILAEILFKSLQCAEKLSNSPTVFYTCLLELLSPQLLRNISVSEHASLIKKLTVGDSNKEATILSPDHIFSCLTVKTYFRHSMGFVGDEIPLQIHLSSFISLPLHQIVIVFSNADYNQTITNTPSRGDKFEFSYPNSNWKHFFIRPDKGKADLHLDKESVLILQTSLTILQPQELRIKEIQVYFTPNVISSHSFNVSSTKSLHTFRWFKEKKRRWIKSESVSNPRFIRINHKQPEFRLEVKHSPPGLLGERYQLHLRIINGEVEGMRAYMNVKSSNDTANDDKLEFSGKSHQQNFIERLDLGLIESKQNKVFEFALVPLNVCGTRNLSFTLFFRLLSEQSTADLFSNDPANGFYSQLSETVAIDVLDPFQLNATPRIISEFQLLTMKISNKSPVPLTIIDVSSEGLSSKEFNGGTNVDFCLEKGAAMNVVFRKNNANHNNRVEIKWKRQDSNETQIFSTVLTMAEANLPFKVDTIFPTGFFRYQNAKVIYKIVSQVKQVLNLVAIVESSEFFSYAGPKQLSFNLLPFDSMEFSYSCVPLLTGKSELPNVRFFRKIGETLNQVNIGSEKKYCFVFPEVNERPIREEVKLIDL